MPTWALDVPDESGAWPVRTEVPSHQIRHGGGRLGVGDGGRPERPRLARHQGLLPHDLAHQLLRSIRCPRRPGRRGSGGTRRSPRIPRRNARHGPPVPPCGPRWPRPGGNASGRTPSGRPLASGTSSAPPGTSGPAPGVSRRRSHEFILRHYRGSRAKYAAAF